MSDSPETIWAILRDNSYPEEGGEWLDESASFRDEYNPTKYTRTDTIPTWNTDMEAAPSDTPLALGKWIDWPRKEFHQEIGHAHNTKGGWRTTCTHWKPLSPPP